MHQYLLEFQGETIPLFESEIHHEAESGLLAEMNKNLVKSAISLLETKIQILYSRFESINHESEYWQDNLKTLLAHGFGVLNLKENQILRKSYYPLTFTLLSEGTKRAHHFGHFYQEAMQSPDLQFIKFCKMSEYPTGITEEIVLQVLLNDGGKLVAEGPSGFMTLIQREPRTDLISGSSEVIYFFSKPVTPRVA